jgi:hypothetical protein
VYCDQDGFEMRVLLGMIVVSGDAIREVVAALVSD